MIGEWTNHQLFPPPKSGESRFAHVEGLEEGFHHRHPSLVTWARACFEQGALPSLSVLPGAVEVRSLAGDKMFQAPLKDGQLPESFPRHAWNLAVGTWFRLEGTQTTSLAHKLCIPAGQQTMPLP